MIVRQSEVYVRASGYFFYRKPKNCHQNERKKEKKRKKIGLQGMFAGIRVLDNNIENFKMVKDKTRRSISLLNSRI